MHINYFAVIKLLAAHFLIKLWQNLILQTTSSKTSGDTLIWLDTYVRVAMAAKRIKFVSPLKISKIIRGVCYGTAKSVVRC